MHQIFSFLSLSLLELQVLWPEGADKYAIQGARVLIWLKVFSLSSLISSGESIDPSLTVQTDGPVRAPERVLCHALVLREVPLGHVADVELHVDLVAAVHDQGLVLLVCERD